MYLEINQFVNMSRRRNQPPPFFFFFFFFFFVQRILKCIIFLSDIICICYNLLDTREQIFNYLSLSWYNHRRIIKGTGLLKGLDDLK